MERLVLVAEGRLGRKCFYVWSWCRDVHGECEGVSMECRINSVGEQSAHLTVRSM